MGIQTHGGVHSAQTRQLLDWAASHVDTKIDEEQILFVMGRYTAPSRHTVSFMVGGYHEAGHGSLRHRQASPKRPESWTDG